MSEDTSWIDHSANLRANASLLRVLADQNLLSATKIETLKAEVERLNAEVAHLRSLAGAVSDGQSMADIKRELRG